MILTQPSLFEGDEEIVSIFCDVCKKEFKNNDNKDCIEFQEILTLENICGLGSIFGDGSTIRLDICQHCLKEKLGGYIRID